MKFDNIELLRENIHRKDLQLIQKIRQRDMSLIEERFKKWEKCGGWDDFVRKAESEGDKGKEVLKVDFTPIEIMCKFIENGGDPSVYLKAISISYPGKKWLSDLFEISKGCVREENESEMYRASDIAGACA